MCAYVRASVSVCVCVLHSCMYMNLYACLQCTALKIPTEARTPDALGQRRRRPLSPTPAGGLVVTGNREAMTTNIFSARYPRPPGGYSSPGEKHSVFLFSSLGEFGDIYLRIFFFSEIYFGVFFYRNLSSGPWKHSSSFIL